MPKLIDKEELIFEYYRNPTYANLCKAINNATVIDAEPVRHGHWIDRGYMKVGYHCSLCGGYVIAGKEKYCPNCGAKMDEDEVEE